VIWLLTHIGGDTAEGQAYMIESNFLLKILGFMEADNVDGLIFKQSLWFVTVLSKASPALDYELTERILKLLCNYIKCKDSDIVNNCLWSLGNFTNTKHSSALRVVIDSGAVPVIFGITSFNTLQLVEAPLRIFGNLLCGDDYIIDSMINYGAIPFLSKYLDSNVLVFKREAAWALSNIGAGTKSQIRTLIDSGVFPKICETAKGTSLDVIREAIWGISNCLNGADVEDCAKMINQGALDAIIYVLAYITNANILVITLEGLRNLFNQGQLLVMMDSPNLFVEKFNQKGGIEFLERAQQHENKDVYDLAISILETFFRIESVQH